MRQLLELGRVDGNSLPLGNLGQHCQVRCCLIFLRAAIRGLVRPDHHTRGLAEIVERVMHPNVGNRLGKAIGGSSLASIVKQDDAPIVAELGLETRRDSHLCSCSRPPATRSFASSARCWPNRPMNGPKDAATSASTSSPAAASRSSPTPETR